MMDDAVKYPGHVMKIDRIYRKLGEACTADVSDNALGHVLNILDALTPVCARPATQVATEEEFQRNVVRFYGVSPDEFVAIIRAMKQLVRLDFDGRHSRNEQVAAEVVLRVKHIEALQ